MNPGLDEKTKQDCNGVKVILIDSASLASMRPRDVRQFRSECQRKYKAFRGVLGPGVPASLMHTQKPSVTKCRPHS